MAIDRFANLGCKFFRNAFPFGSEFFRNVFYPVLLWNFFQVNDVAEFVERLACIVKDALHQVFLASKQAIGDSFLVLPNRAQLCLKLQGIIVICNLLELVDANDYVAVFLLNVLIPYLKLETSFAVSLSLSVNVSPETALPKMNNLFIVI